MLSVAIPAWLQPKLEALARSMSAAQGRPVTAEEVATAALGAGVEAIEDLATEQLSSAGSRAA